MASTPVPERQIVTILVLLVCLVGVVLGKQRCGRAVDDLFRALELPNDGGVREKK